MRRGQSKMSCKPLSRDLLTYVGDRLCALDREKLKPIPPKRANKNTRVQFRNAGWLTTVSAICACSRPPINKGGATGATFHNQMHPFPERVSVTSNAATVSF